MWVLSTLLIGHLYLSGIWHGFVVKNKHQNDSCYKEVEQCAQNLEINLGLTVNTMGRALCDHLK